VVAGFALEGEGLEFFAEHIVPRAYYKLLGVKGEAELELVVEGVWLDGEEELVSVKSEGYGVGIGVVAV